MSVRYSNTIFVDLVLEGVFVLNSICNGKKKKNKARTLFLNSFLAFQWKLCCRRH